MITIGAVLLLVACMLGLLGVLGIYNLCSKLDDMMMCIAIASAVTGVALVIVGSIVFLLGVLP